MHVVSVLVALTAALVARAVLQVALRDAGIARQFAADLSYLVVPPLLVLLLFPVLKASTTKLQVWFTTSNLNARLVTKALALGILLRLSWWCHLIAGVSLGLYRGDDPTLANGPTLVFQCPPGYMLVTGAFVMALLVPIVEEIIHRGFVQSYLSRFGPVLAISGSAVAFTVFHPLGSWAFVFLAGVVFGTLFWITRSLWASLITHATINGLVQLDWYCLKGQWNPPAHDVPNVAVATTALILLMFCAVLIIVLLKHIHRGERSPR